MILPYILTAFVFLVLLVFLCQSGFIIIPNPKYDKLILRMIFAGPMTFMAFGLLSMFYFLILSLSLLSPLVYAFGEYGILTPTILSTLSIMSFYYFFLKIDEKPNDRRADFLDHDYYIYTPAVHGKEIQKYHYLHMMNTGSDYPETVVFRKNEHFPDIDILFTNYSHLVVSKKVLNVLNEYSLSGFETKGIEFENANASEKYSDKYVQIVPTSEMPQYSLKSTIKFGDKEDRVSPNGRLYYNSSEVSNLSDINETKEKFAVNCSLDCLECRNLMIFSQKTVRVFIEELGQPKRDFQPVYLIED